MADDLEQSARPDRPRGRSMYEFVVDDSNLEMGASPKGAPKIPVRGERQHTQMIRFFVAGLTIMCMIVFGAIVFTNKTESGQPATAVHTGSTYDSGFNMKQNWGAYSPYFDTGKPFNGISENSLQGIHTLPETCSYKQVHILHRHGDRYPAGGTADKIEVVAEKLKAMSKEPHKKLAWLKDWEYALGRELLVSTGVATLFTSGSKFWGSHGQLLYNTTNTSWNSGLNKFPDGSSRPKPLLRATTQYRIEESARAWAAGFFGTYGHPATEPDTRKEYDLVLQVEEMGYNNSLAGYFACPNAEAKNAESGSKRKWKWVDHYLKDAAKRLQTLLPGYEDFGPRDALAFQDLCTFETAAYGSSPFCELFTETEWRGFEYHLDLMFYGESGWGSHVGPATGLAWLEELHARLTHQLISESHNGVNTTLTSAESTFPLDQPFYADFTHDSVIVSVLSALQFEWIKKDLSPKKIKVPRQFILSRLTPFGARLYVEILSCDKSDMVRLKLNDRVLNLGDLKYCSNDSSGLCSLPDFIKSLESALSSIDFEDVCYAEHDWETPKLD